MEKLNAQSVTTNILLRTMGQEKVVETQVLSDLEVAELHSDKFMALPETFSQEAIPICTNRIPSQEDIKRWDYLKDIKIPSLDVEVGLRIGANAAKLMEPWEVINSQEDGPYAIKTLLGWVINGPLRANVKGCSAIYANRISIVKLEELLISQYIQDFNEKRLEERLEMSQEDLKFMAILERSTCQLDGHFCMDLPFKEDTITMPNNKSVAEQRLKSLKRRFDREPRFQEEYTRFLTEVIDNGYAEAVPTNEITGEEGKVWYLPHHGVCHPKKKSLRVVFDCAATFKGISLNSKLLQGPDLTNPLFGVLTRFRENPVALMADIKAMFHQVKVSKKHLNFFRFLWWPMGNSSVNPVEHRMKVHLFGAVSSPSVANYALRRTAVDNQNMFGTEVTDTVHSNFYVDDCLKSLATEEEAVQMVKDLTDLCSRGGFHSSKWTSNSRTVLSSILESNQSIMTREVDPEQDSLPVERALGLQWCAENDKFIFKPEKQEKAHTRRGILSAVSSIYDPLGFLSPFTLLPKILLQEMCRQKMSWDEPISQTQLLQWSTWLTDLKKVEKLDIDRCVKPKGFQEPLHMQLHHFADASGHGYSTVSYLRLENQEKKVHLAFMLGKARVTPLKETTIPRPELTAAVLSTKVDRMLRNELHFELQRSLFWTDSQTVLK
nr:uncharacterized protein LOC107396521 [Nothobranchius furzeri]